MTNGLQVYFLKFLKYFQVILKKWDVTSVNTMMCWNNQRRIAKTLYDDKITESEDSLMYLKIKIGF